MLQEFQRVPSTRKEKKTHFYFLPPDNETMDGAARSFSAGSIIPGHSFFEKGITPGSAYDAHNYFIFY